MNDLLQLAGWFSILFAASFAAAYLLTKRRAALRGRGFFVAPDTAIRLSGPSGSFRSRFLHADKSSWMISAPLQRDAFVPLRIGEGLLVQAPGAGGVWMFRTTVIDRQMEGHLLVLARPEHPHLVDRRAHPRLTDVRGASIRLNGDPAELIDCSQNGACVLTDTPLANGDDIVLDLHADLGEARGWALECAPLRGVDGRRTIRIAFSEPVPALGQKKKLLRS